MKRHLDVLLATAGSSYAALIHHVTDAVLSYGPGVLTMIYVGVKIFYKIKRERQGRRDREWEE